MQPIISIKFRFSPDKHDYIQYRINKRMINNSSVSSYRGGSDYYREQNDFFRFLTREINEIQLITE